MLLGDTYKRKSDGVVATVAFVHADGATLKIASTGAWERYSHWQIQQHWTKEIQMNQDKYSGSLESIVLVFTIPTDASDAWIENDHWLDDFMDEAGRRLGTGYFHLKEVEGPLVNGAVACTVTVSGEMAAVAPDYLAQHWKVAQAIIRPVFRAAMTNTPFEANEQ